MTMTDADLCNEKHPNRLLGDVRCIMRHKVVRGRYVRHEGPHWDGERHQWTTSTAPR